ncbi:MAG: site-specific integrase, partial [Halomonadaceae bacterium]
MDLIDAFLDALWLERGASEHTLAAYRRDLEAWRDTLEADGDMLASPPPGVLVSWFDARRTQGYQLRSNARLLSSLRSFYRWARLHGHVASDPLAGIRLPPVRPNLPGVLDEDEVERLLAAPDTATPLGLRDRTMLELLYA